MDSEDFGRILRLLAGGWNGIDGRGYGFSLGHGEQDKPLRLSSVAVSCWRMDLRTLFLRKKRRTLWMPSPSAGRKGLSLKKA